MEYLIIMILIGMFAGKRKRIVIPENMDREIKYIVIHTTATDQTASVQSILNYWRNQRGWQNPGYHYIVKPNGDIEQLLSISKVSNGVKGYNQNSIHISYIGGKDGIDNRTAAQKKSIRMIVNDLKELFPGALIMGHRDFPGVTKSCPNFNVMDEFKS